MSNSAFNPLARQSARFCTDQQVAGTGLSFEMGTRVPLDAGPFAVVDRDRRSRCRLQLGDFVVFWWFLSQPKSACPKTIRRSANM